MNMIRSLEFLLGNIPEWHGDFRAIIKVTETGFDLVNKKELLAHINWSDIKEVVAYRRDFKTELLVCFALRVSDDNGFIEIEEEMAGFKEFGTALDNKLRIHFGDIYKKMGNPAHDAFVRIY